MNRYYIINNDGFLGKDGTFDQDFHSKSGKAFMTHCEEQAITTAKIYDAEITYLTHQGKMGSILFAG